VPVGKRGGLEKEKLWQLAAATKKWTETVKNPAEEERLTFLGEKD